LPLAQSLIRQAGRRSLDRNDHETLLRQWLADHTGLLLKVVRSFADGPADADDLFQEILLQVWLSLPSYRSEAKATTWLYRVALNTSLAWKRREKRQRRASSLPGSIEIVEGGRPEETLANREAVERLYTAIRALQPAQRALVLLYLEGLSYAEMADVVGISEANVGVRLHRIKKELALQLKVPTNVV
jgi:RNA polymerase sigma-70 factor, ECF subfamily